MDWDGVSTKGSKPVAESEWSCMLAEPVPALKGGSVLVAMEYELHVQTRSIPTDCDRQLEHIMYNIKENNGK